LKYRDPIGIVINKEIFITTFVVATVIFRGYWGATSLWICECYYHKRLHPHKFLPSAAYGERLKPTLLHA